MRYLSTMPRLKNSCRHKSVPQHLLAGASSQHLSLADGFGAEKLMMLSDTSLLLSSLLTKRAPYDPSPQTH